MSSFVTLEICAGAGGQSLGLEQAGVTHAAAVEIDADACNTLRLNRPGWAVIEGDVRQVDGRAFRGIDLLSGGVPCPPFSIAGRQLGSKDERDLFPEALRLVSESQPSAVMLENVRGLAGARFADYRRDLLRALGALGFRPFWRLLNASDFGVPQLRPRFLLVAVRERYASEFVWPAANVRRVPVGEALFELMAENGWLGAQDWAARANAIAPTIVGGSKKHGGPDLGPTRARTQWQKLGVNGKGIADFGPSIDDPHDLTPKLTIQMVAKLQGFPSDWRFTGKKTAAYRQVGNAFPPPVARAVVGAICDALHGTPRTHKGQLSLAAAGIA